MILNHKPGYGVASSLVGAAALGLLIFLATAYYTYTVTPEFTAQATLQLEYIESATFAEEGSGIADLFPVKFTFADLQSMAVSSDLATAVADRFDDEERLAFLAPYAAAAEDIYAALERNRAVIFHPETKQIAFHYTHPDAVQAARVANLFADEMLSLVVNRKIEMIMNPIETLRISTEKQLEIVEGIKARLAEANAAEAVALRDELEINEDLHKTMMSQLQTEMSRVGPCVGPTMRLIEKAVPPSTPSSPNVTRNLLLGAAPLPLLLLLAFFRHQRQ